MSAVAAWIAPIATVIAAMMTAMNLGARVTGIGFIIFVIGSLSWSVVGAESGQTNLLITNGFLTLVNVVGVWRWLGRQAGYDAAGKVAARKSRAATTPDLLSVAKLAGSKVLDSAGDPIGMVVDAMMSAKDGAIAYVVVSEGGVAGVGERLHAIDVDELDFSGSSITCQFGCEELEARRALSPSDWPAHFRPH